MIVLGITGPYASGKSTLAAELERRGWYHIEVDRLGHHALVRRKAEVVKYFGQEILDEADGNIDRRKLGSLVFSNPQQLAALEAIVHPDMVAQVSEIIAAQSSGDGEVRPGVIVNAAILYKMGLHRLCDLVLWVRAPLLRRVFRAKQRDGLSLTQLFQRFRSQKQVKPQLADKSVDMYTVDNRQRGRALRQIDEILRDWEWNRTRST